MGEKSAWKYCRTCKQTTVHETSGSEKKGTCLKCGTEFGMKSEKSPGPGRGAIQVVKPFCLHVEDQDGNFKYKGNFETAARARSAGMRVVGDFYVTREGKLYEGD